MLRRSWVLAALPLASCIVNLDLPKGAVVACTPGLNQCPTGYTCSETLGQCVKGDAALAPPEITRLAADRTLLGKGQTLRVAIETDQALGKAPEITLDFHGVSKTLEAAGEGAAWELEYAVSDDDPEGFVTLRASVVNPSGGRSVTSRQNFVRIDRTPPKLGSARVSLLPAATNRLTDVEAVTNGTRVEIELTTNEPLDGPPAVVAVGMGGAAIAFADVVTNENPYFVLGATLAPEIAAADGDYTIAITATDIAGNVTDPPLGARALHLVIDRQPPAAPLRITHTRVPWGTMLEPAARFSFSGNKSTEPRAFIVALTGAFEAARVRVDGEGTFADTPLAAADDPALSFIAVDTAGNESTPVLAKTGRWTATMIGKMPGDTFANPNVFNTIAENNGALFDPTGAEPSPSQMARLAQSGESNGILRIDTKRPWFERKQAGPSTLLLGSMVDMTAIASVFFFGGALANLFSDDIWRFDGRAWSLVDAVGARPSGRGGAAMTYDPFRNRAIMFGGTDTLTAGLDDTWEFDGKRWIPIAIDPSARPRGRFMAAMTFDTERQRAVLFGGAVPGATASTCLDGTFTNASACVLNDVWEYDGSAWTLVSAGGPPTPTRPAARIAPGIVYEQTLSRVILFGGALGDSPLTIEGDTWSYEPSSATWTQIITGNAALDPPRRVGHGMFFDTTVNRAAIAMGCNTTTNLLTCTTALNDVWTLNAEVSPMVWELRHQPTDETIVSKRAFAGIAFDGAGNQIVVHGGNQRISGGPCSGVYCPDGAPTVAQGGGADCMCFDAATAAYRTANDFAASPWTVAFKPSSAPEATAAFAMSFDTRLNQLVLVGGENRSGTSCDGGAARQCYSTWMSGGGGSWKKHPLPLLSACGPTGPTSPTGQSITTMPCYRTNGSLAMVNGVGPSNKHVVLFGGRANTNTCDETNVSLCSYTWTFNGTDWHLACGTACTAPKPRELSAMASGDAVYLFGGIGGSAGGGTSADCPVSAGTDTTESSTRCLYHDLWKGTTAGGLGNITWTKIPVSGTWPAARYGHALVYDSKRGKLLMFGGCTTVEPSMPSSAECAVSGYTNETWEFVDGPGGGWTKRMPAHLPPARMNFAMAYDADRARVMVHGGNWQSTPRVTHSDAFEWDGDDWQALSFDFSPGSRERHQAAYDEDRQLYTMVGGQGPGETWELNARASVKPAGFFEIAWDTAGIAADRIDKITLRIDAVGVGYTRDQALGADGDLIGDRIEGTDISMWEARRASWNRLASCTPTAPSTNTCVVTFEPFRYVLPGTQRLYARVVPTQGSGNGPELAHVDIDYMELTVEYSP